MFERFKKKGYWLGMMLCTMHIVPALSQSALDKRVDALVQAMSTQEKISHLINVGFGGTPANTRLNIPGFIMSDGPHGVRFTADRFGRTATSFPTGIAMAATWDEELARKVGESMGVEFWAFNRTQQLGPCLDLARDSRGGRTAESGGEDPYLAGQMGKSVVMGIQKFPVIATLKHFMGESKQSDRMNMNVVATERWLMDFAGYNFRTAMQDAGAMCVMGAYNKINGDKCSESSLLLKSVLRDRWGFPFYVVSDWASIATAKKALQAGTDVCMGSSIYEADLPTLVASGGITTDDLDRAVKKVLKTKILNGMLDYFPRGNEALAKTSEIGAINRLAAQKSVILLKNGKKSDATPILPLPKTGLKIALIGPNATAKNLNCYGSSATQPAYAVSIKEGIEAKAGASNVTYVKGCDINSTATDGFEAAKSAAMAADVVIFAGGIDSTQEGEGYGTGHDRTGDTFALPVTQQNLINELAAVNPNLVAVIQSGGVCSLHSCLPAIKGLIYSFYSSQEAGNAIADVIFGDYNPAGRMPLSMPVSDTDFPSWSEDVFRYFTVNLDGGYRWLDEKGIAPEFAFGYGLSYTTFSYAHLVMPANVIAGQSFTASVDVTNTGAVAGEEVVQLYISEPSGASLWMPKKELRGFRRIALAPGETRTVTFNFSADDFYHWNETSKAYEVQPGSYMFRVGGASDNLPLAQSVVFANGEQKPDLRITQLYTMPRYPIQGQPVSFYALVKNQGNAVTQIPCNISFEISGKEVAKTTQSMVTIAPGQVQLIASDQEWNCDNEGKTTVSGRVSFDSPDTEWDISNNVFTRDFEIFDPGVNSEVTNLAYLKNVTTSSVNGKYYCSQLVDGDLSTRWDSKRTDDEWAMVDLEAIGEVEKINLYWEASFAKKYVIEKSLDGQDWTTLKNITAGAGGVESYTFDKFQARYIRIHCLERTTINSSKYGFSLYEIEVIGSAVRSMPSAKIITDATTLCLPYAKTYLDGTQSVNSVSTPLTYLWKQVSGPSQATIAGPGLSMTTVSFTVAGTYVFRLTVSNGSDTDSKECTVLVKNVDSATDLALYKPATASGSEAISTYPKAAVDGDGSTRWSSAFSNNQWWQVDLQHQVTPSQIAIVWQSAYAKNFNIQISADGKVWNTYGANTAFAGGTSSMSNTNGLSGRYLKVNCVERQTSYGSSFYSFNLYGSYATGVNQLPKATAPAILTSANGSAGLDGTASSDADGDALTYKWEELTGPAFVNILNPQNAKASVSGLKEGSYFFKLTVDDGKDIDFTIVNVQVKLSTPVKEVTVNQVEVYPNPVKEALFIKSSESDRADRAEIYDLNGILAISENIVNNCILLHNLPSGMYCVRIYSQKRIIGNIKIIKET
ncbi:glycoside hydrolase family 3 N-terminal domain-containing protein [Parabacteroides sp. FAFU027]|uniref:glycoside hydrolase family 3 N-terminal domain-containing protein n=1 Tax=Parabacteroides sp. FAFU027 TaxID=2922715 RepID=UPI001FAFC7EF|nr:glycoside hydrolase family 3 N-terminal domain-containing protein [Parabacteroides sp. FAFU027]